MPRIARYTQICPEMPKFAQNAQICPDLPRNAQNAQICPELPRIGILIYLPTNSERKFFLGRPVLARNISSSSNIAYQRSNIGKVILETFWQEVLSDLDTKYQIL